MKKLILALLFLSTIACKKEELVINQAPGSLEKITLDNILPLIPLEKYETNTRVIFANEGGEEKAFYLELERTEKNKIRAGTRYQSEQIDVIYRDSINDQYALTLSASGYYPENEDQPDTYLNVAIQQTYTPYTTFYAIYEDGQIGFGVFHESITLNAQIFHDTYGNTFSKGYEPYGQLYYQAEQGIIGFNDQSGNLYTFKEFRK